MHKNDEEEIILSPEPPHEDKDADGMKGLCSHCKKLDHCTYPKPEGGVWDCDEYKSELEENHA